MIRAGMEKVVIVGAGMTGAFTSFLIRNNMPSVTTIKVVDKSRGTGGRMATSRCQNKDLQSSTLDLGAQYFSISEHYASKHSIYHDELIKNKILSPLTGEVEGDKSPPTTKHYIAPAGSGSVVKHFMQSAKVDTTFSQLVTAVDIVNDTVRLTSDQGTEMASGVVLTMPVPQILQLAGNIQRLIDDSIRQKLQKVKYSSRFAIGLFYPPETSIPYTWCSKYITGNPCIRFVSIDNKKRGLSEEGVGPSVVVHCSVPFSLEHLEKDKDEMKDVILRHTLECLPDLPKPLEVKGHKWRYSQVHEKYEEAPGCVVLSEKPLVILSGDAFSHSNMDGCMASGLKVLDCFKSLNGRL